MSGIRRLAVVAAAACVLSVTSPVPPAEGASGQTGSVAGVVTGPGGPIAGVSVVLHPAGGGTVTATTSATGTYQASAAAGTVLVEFDGSALGYVPEYWDGATSPADADPVTIVADALRTGVDAVLALGGTVRGTVTGPSGPVGGAVVSTEGPLPVRTTVTAGDGTYRLDGVPPGGQRVRADGWAGALAALYHPAALGAPDAQVVAVTAGGTTTGVDVALVPGGAIEGTVTDVGSGPLAGVTVHAHPSTGVAPAVALTGGDGTYRLAGLPVDQGYQVEFDGSATHHGVVWFDGAASDLGAQPLALTAGATTAGIDAVLSAAGTIAGTVTAAGGGSAAGVVVRAFALPAGGSPWTGTTASDGTYAVGGLPTGSYMVTFDGSPAGMVSEVFDNRAHESEADPVDVTAGATHGGVDAELARGGGFSGTVTGAGGPVAGARVLGLCGSYFQSTRTAADGTYALTGLPPGTCVLQFNASSQGYVTEYYDDAATEAAADALTVVAGVVTPAVNAALAYGGSISGTVTGPSGPVHANVYAETLDHAAGASTTSRTEDGAYTVAGLPPGEYVLHVVPIGPGLRPEYFDDSISLSHAALVPVGLLEAVAEIDVALASADVPLFTDVASGHPFYDEIEWLAVEGVTTGYPDGTFHPSAFVERQAMAAFLYRFAGEPAFAPPAVPTFTDVPTSAPFFHEIEWLASTGITTGWPDHTFRPMAGVERQAMAAFLYRYAGEPAFLPPGAASFVDLPTTATFFPEVEWLASTGITTGWPDRTFRPTASVERQAMAAFLMRFDDAGLRP